MSTENVSEKLWKNPICKIYVEPPLTPATTPFQEKKKNWLLPYHFRMWDATLLMSRDRATPNIIRVRPQCPMTSGELCRTNTPNVSNANMKNVPDPTGQHKTKTPIRCNRSACCRKARGTLHAATEE